MFETIGLAPTNFNIVVATSGAFLLVFGLVSHGVKQRLLLSEALVSVLAGVFLSHIVTLVRPPEYTCNPTHNVETITLEFSRLVLGIQLLLAGTQLPPKFMYTARKSLFYLLGPGLALSWLSAGLVIYAVLPRLGFLGALTIAACIAPTDPVLSNAILKGRFAEENTPAPLRDLISAEAGTNDGLGYPFLFFCLLYYRSTLSGSSTHAMLGTWLTDTWCYIIIFSVIYGAAAGYTARKLQQWSARRGLIEDESSLVAAVALSLLVLGSSGILGTDDVLACFTAGCAYGWSDTFRPTQTDDLFSGAVDLLLNTSIFIWYGAVAPWSAFTSNPVISLPRLLLLAFLILTLRRLPIILTLRPRIRELTTTSQAAFVGFFGPIGVSAIFYLAIAREFLASDNLSTGKHAELEFLAHALWVVVWFLVMSSVVVHGVALPVARVFRWLVPRGYPSGMLGVGRGCPGGRRWEAGMEDDDTEADVEVGGGAEAEDGGGGGSGGKGDCQTGKECGLVREGGLVGAVRSKIRLYGTVGAGDAV